MRSPGCCNGGTTAGRVASSTASLQQRPAPETMCPLSLCGAGFPCCPAAGTACGALGTCWAAAGATCLTPCKLKSAHPAWVTRPIFLLQSSGTNPPYRGASVPSGYVSVIFQCVLRSRAKRVEEAAKGEAPDSRAKLRFKSCPLHFTRQLPAWGQLPAAPMHQCAMARGAWAWSPTWFPYRAINAMVGTLPSGLHLTLNTHSAPNSHQYLTLRVEFLSTRTGRTIVQPAVKGQRPGSCQQPLLTTLAAIAGVRTLMLESLTQQQVAMSA